MTCWNRQTDTGANEDESRPIHPHTPLDWGVLGQMCVPLQDAATWLFSDAAFARFRYALNGEKKQMAIKTNENENMFLSFCFGEKHLIIKSKYYGVMWSANCRKIPRIWSKVCWSDACVGAKNVTLRRNAVIAPHQPTITIPTSQWASRCVRV